MQGFLFKRISRTCSQIIVKWDYLTMIPGSLSPDSYREANAKGSPPSEACFLFSLTCTKVDWGLAFAYPRFTQGCKCKRQHPAGVVFLFCFRSPKGIAFRSLQQNKKATLLRGLLHLPVIPLGTHIFSESLYLQAFQK